MIFSLALHASAKRVVLEYSSIVRRIACCAALVMESASSSNTILCRPGGNVTFFCANILILLRTTSMPRSSEAFSSSTASLYAGPSSVCARHKMEVVLPMPGGPVKIRFGMFPVVAIAPSRSTASLLPTISSIFVGRYFSTQGRVLLLATFAIVAKGARPVGRLVGENTTRASLARACDVKCRRGRCAEGVPTQSRRQIQKV